MRWFCAIVLAGCSAVAQAQEIEPRAYSNIPLGVNFAVASYGSSSGGLATDPTLPLDDAHLTIDTLVVGYARSIAVRGQSGKFDIIVPFGWLEGEANYGGEPLRRRVSGFGDPRARISINLLGAPALPLADFPSYRQGTIVGVSLQVSAPLGQYDPSRVVNIGTNRWWARPEIGISRAAGPWTFEAMAAATFFGDNDDFRDGSLREQDPVYSIQGGIIYGFQRGIWAALHGTYYRGGRSSVDGVTGDDLQSNSLVALTVALPLNRRDSLKILASTGVATRIGTDVDTINVAWQRRWGVGL